MEAALGHEEVDVSVVDLDEIKEKLSGDVKEYYKLVAERNKTLDALKGYAVASAPEAAKAAETDGE